jgi:energy-coupling factor transport system permease protein
VPTVRVTPRYLGRGSWLSRRDPRVLVLALALFVLSVVQVWDVRILAVLAAIAYLYYRAARIPFREVRANWAYVLFFITFIILVNTILTGGELRGYTDDELHVFFRLPLLGTPISAESLTYALAQYLRFIPMAAMGFPIAFAVAPADIGATFARLGVPDRFAYALDLTYRFIPSLAADMRTTIDAQRVRGYDWERIGRGPIGKVRRVGPLMVPVTVNAIVGAEDTIDAMDMRAFGTGRRTWLRHLAFDQTDRGVLAAFAVLFVVVTFLSLTGRTELWVPELLQRLGT